MEASDVDCRDVHRSADCVLVVLLLAVSWGARFGIDRPSKRETRSWRVEEKVNVAFVAVAFLLGLAVGAFLAVKSVGKAVGATVSELQKIGALKIDESATNATAKKPDGFGDL